MSDRYKIRDNDKVYFVTLTIVGWIDVFTRIVQKNVVVDALKYCQDNKGLILFGWCLMSSHLHLLCRADEGHCLSDILRDFKKFTSKEIVKTIIVEPESRREWILNIFTKEGRKFRRKQDYKVWQSGNHAEEVFTTGFLYEKLRYIHNNPVKDLIVQHPEEYLFSSARNYAGLDSYVDVVVLGHKPLVQNWRM